MKPACTTYWVLEAGANLKTLQAQHNRAYPGNRLGMAQGWVKVAVPTGETPPNGATTVKPMPKTEITGNATL